MELKQAKDGFKEELGRGAFATVYKGVLAFDHVMKDLKRPTWFR